MDITEIAGYRVLRPIGAGGMGQVFLVEHPRLPRRDALKLLDAGVSRNDDFKARFQREADLLAQLSHPNIVTLHDRGEYEGRLWITMEFIDGTDAGHLLETRGRLPLSLALSLIGGAGAALDHAWRKQRITHRDVKPANILVGFDDAHPEPIVETVKLADFGIAKAAEESTSLTSTGVAVGTLAYMSPEAIEGQPVDNRADVYSLGCTAFHLITGQPPFTGNSMTALMSAHLHGAVPSVVHVAPELPLALDPVFRRVLAKNPDHRYSTCAAFVADLAAAMNGRAPTILAPMPPAPTGRHRRLTAITAVCVSAAFVIAGAVAYALWQPDGAAPIAAPSSTTAPATPATTTTTLTTPDEPTPTTVIETTPVEEPVTTTAPTTPEPYEGQPCGPSQFNEHNADGTLYCSALEGAWTDLTHQSRPAVDLDTECTEPGARARVNRTERIVTCTAGSDGVLRWS